MKDWKFYHGTSKEAYKSIVKHGFILSELRYHNFLGPQGVYLIPNRPVLAFRFAKQAARLHSSQPLVLEIPLNLDYLSCVLDLTTDEGMNRFYEAYIWVQRLTKKPFRLGKNTPHEFREYAESLRASHKWTLDILKKAQTARKGDPRRFNWDNVAIECLQREAGVKLIIEAIQEGTTFNKSFFREEPFYRGVPDYKGIRCRDHLEICVTDLGLINVKKIKEYEICSKKYDHDLVNWIANIDSCD